MDFGISFTMKAHPRETPRQSILAHWEELKSNWNPQECIKNMTVVQLRELARANKVRLPPYGVNKAQMVETLFLVSSEAG